MNEQAWWYLSRASGLVAWALLIGSLVLGVLLATRALKPLDRPAWLLAMHRWFSGLAVTATVVHLLALVFDGYVQFGAKEIFVPMASTWQPGAVAVGVVAMYVMALVQVTSLMMKRLPKRLWRGVHMTSYLLVWTATVHAGMAGTDATNRVYQAVALLLTIAAVSATVLRIIVGRRGGTVAATGSGTARPATEQTTATAVEDPAGVAAARLSDRAAMIAAARASRAAGASAAATPAPAQGSQLPPPTSTHTLIRP
jgi:DMSO/TMAO reductase YedYZ heme-binding membrane subunit